MNLDAEMAKDVSALDVVTEKRMIEEEKSQAAQMKKDREDKLNRQAPIWERTRMDMVRLRAQDAIDEIMNGV